MWSYDSANGNLSQDGTFVGTGYSGFGDGVNNPEEEMDADIGPIPRGEYTIDPFFDDPGGKGPIVAHLIPSSTTTIFNRSGFMIHGDNAAMNHTASHGCIILSRDLRQKIADSGDTSLEVV
jgi:type VI secretion system (T6SS) effector TldE1-like protein